MKSDEEILSELTDVFKAVLDVDDLVLSIATRADDVEEWDSLSHMQLVLAIGKKFGMKFTTAEVISWTNLRSIVETIKRHMV